MPGPIRCQPDTTAGTPRPARRTARHDQHQFGRSCGRGAWGLCPTPKPPRWWCRRTRSTPLAPTPPASARSSSMSDYAQLRCAIDHSRDHSPVYREMVGRCAILQDARLRPDHDGLCPTVGAPCDESKQDSKLTRSAA